MANSVPNGPWGLAIRLVGKALAWLRQRPFLLAPRTWVAIFVVGAVIAFLSGLLAGSVIALAPGAVVMSAAVLPFLSWRRVRGPARCQPTVVIARFRDENPAHNTVATVHLREVERRLSRQPLLSEYAHIAALRAPLTEQHARRILRHSTVLAVASGTGLLVAEHARWEGWMLTRWPVSSGQTDLDAETGEVVMRNWRSYLSDPEHGALLSDTRFPVQCMTEDILPADHARGIEATVLVIVAAWHPSPAVRRECIAATEALNEALPLPVQAVLANLKAMEYLDDTGDVAGAASQLEAVGDAGVDHPFLWNHCLSLIVAGEQHNSNELSDRVRVGQKAVRCAPRNPISCASLGIGLVATERHHEAIPHLESAIKALPDEDAGLAREALLEAYRAVGRDDAAWSLVKEAYARLSRRKKREMLRAVGLTEEALLQHQPPHEHRSQDA